MQQSIFTYTLIKLIVIYQKHLSPHKGYCCAYSHFHGRSSCSSWAIRILEKQKLSAFLPLMKRRFIACNKAHEDFKKEKTNTNTDAIDPCPCKGSIAESCLVCGFPFIW